MDVKTIAGGVLAAAAGVAGIVVGVMQSEPGFIVIGVAFAIVTVFALIVGATASPRGSLPPKVSFGAKFMGLPDWAMWVVTIVLVLGLVIGGILLANS
jgi:hypothetical protein